MPGFESLKSQLRENVAEHKRYQGVDAMYYNGITAVVLLATTATTLIPIDTQWAPLLKILTGLATFLIALERTLDFGARWRYHREMRHGYLAVLAKINFYENLPGEFGAEERKRYYAEIYADLFSLGRREGEIPGTGGIREPAAVNR